MCYSSHEFFAGSFPKLYGSISGDSGLLLVPACNCDPPTGKVFGCTNGGSNAFIMIHQVL